MVVASSDYSSANSLFFDTGSNFTSSDTTTIMTAAATTQDLLLAYTPKACATLSIPSSLFIIWEAVEDHRKGKGTAIQRALVGMSVVDVCASFAWFLSNWAIPVDDDGINPPLAKGTITSCNFQGFLLQLAVGAPLYNCSLALYYLLVIRFNWTNEQLVKIERYVHSFILAFTIGTSIAGLPLTMYNRVGAVCWVIGSPPECGNSSAGPENEDVPCDRGDYAWLFGMFLFYVPLWLCVLLTVMAMLMIYIQVRRTFGKTRRYLYADSANNHSSRRRRRRGDQQEHRVSGSTHMTVPTATGNDVGIKRGSNASSIGLSGGRDSIDDSSMGFQQEITSPSSPVNLSNVPDEARPLPISREDSRYNRLSIFNPRSTASNMSGMGQSGYMNNNNNNNGSSTAFGNSTTMMCSESMRYNPEELDGLSARDEDDNEMEVPNSRGNRASWLARPAANNNNTTAAPQHQASTMSITTTASRVLETRQRSKQSLFATQAILYSGSFFITWSPSTIWSVASWFNVTSFGIDYAAALCEPLQGFWNMLIFVRRRPSSQKKIYNFFASIFCFWKSDYFCCNNNNNNNDDNSSSRRRGGFQKSSSRGGNSSLRNNPSAADAAVGSGGGGGNVVLATTSNGEGMNNRDGSQTDPTNSTSNGGDYLSSSKRRGRNPGPLRTMQSGQVSSVHFEGEDEDSSDEDDEDGDENIYKSNTANQEEQEQDPRQQSQDGSE